MTVDLSILVCSVHTRYRTFALALQDQLWGQYNALSPIDQERVEIMILTDNKRTMLGEKRNVMVEAAHGRYLQFVDDDDRVAPDMIRTVLDATTTSADVITFLAEVTINAGTPKICHYSRDHRRDRNTPDRYLRIPNHICAVKADLVRKVPFPSIIRGEDSSYSKVLLQHITTEHHIPRVLYFYDYSDATTETQMKLQSKIRTRKGGPAVADMVILSNAKTRRLQQMTQVAINTALAGANSLPLNVTVMEQNSRVKYARAGTLNPDGEFNYNGYANQVLRQCAAEWVVVANNDLRFADGWLHELIAADHPVVSPKNPGDRRQQDIVSNQTGTVNGRHFSGWCFGMRRDFWEQIGGLDERVRFWASDDITIRQCVAAGVEPMLVPSSVVKHAASQTLKETRHPDILTWEQIRVFNSLYPDQPKFADHPKYVAYLRKIGA